MGPTSLPPSQIWVVIVWVRTGPTSRPPQFHIVLMGLLMVDDDMLRCKKRGDKLKRKEDNALKAVHLNPFKVTHLSNVVCLVIGGVGVPSPGVPFPTPHL